MPRLATEALSGPFLRTSLAAGKSTTLRILGNSMAPLLPHGSSVRLRPLADGETLRGALVAIDRGSKVVVHRVESVHADLIHTRGLRAKTLDMACSRQQILGVVSERIGRMPLSETSLRYAGTLIGSAISNLRWVLRR